MAWARLRPDAWPIRVEGLGVVTNRSLAGTLRQGAVTCMLNSKAYFFIIAIYPRFIKSA
jgi:threonine/homoserine/homoserine lactone efflux protein